MKLTDGGIGGRLLEELAVGVQLLRVSVVLTKLGREVWSGNVSEDVGRRIEEAYVLYASYVVSSSGYEVEKAYAEEKMQVQQEGWLIEREWRRRRRGDSACDVVEEMERPLGGWTRNMTERKG